MVVPVHATVSMQRCTVPSPPQTNSRSAPASIASRAVGRLPALGHMTKSGENRRLARQLAP